MMKRRLGQARVIAGLVVLGGGFAAVGGTATGSVTASSPAGHPSPARGLDVLPFPGTPDAPAGTDLDFPAVSPAQIRTVTVVGSRSGRHAGHIRAQPAGHGTAFLPDRPFAPGERVTVTATLRSREAATASGAPGQRRMTFSFTIARPADLTSTRNRAKAAVIRRKNSSQPLTYSLVTEPTFTPPTVTISGTDTDTASGDIFLDAQNTGQNAAYILNPQGQLVWYQPSPYEPGARSIHDVREQRYDGQSVLTYWLGDFVKPPGGGRGEDLVLNHHYQTIHTITAGDGYQSQGIDMHDFVLAKDGSENVAFVPIWSPVKADLTSVGGPANGTVFDWIIQEIDIATGDVIWEWDALAHIPVSNSYLPYTAGKAYDYFHMNSIQPLGDGHLIISSRNTWGVYSIDEATGNVDWELGGKQSSFTMGPGTNFEWQHDATLLGNGKLTLFDDAASPTEESQSRALKLHLNTSTDQATLVHQYFLSPPTLATSQGSVERLPNGDIFVGWGSKPYFSEYTPAGTQIFSGSFVSPVASYRAYRYPWVGNPLQPPAIAVQASSTTGEDDVYASWNGATQVASWQVLQSSSSTGPFTPTGSPAPWSGFETETQVPAAPYFEVQALDSNGHVLATSAPAAGP